MRVVLTREAGKNESLHWMIPAVAEISEVPLTQTVYFSIPAFEAALVDIHDSKAIAISSARAARFVTPALEKLGDLPLYCVGESTAAALRECGISPRWVGAGGATELARAIPEGLVLFIGAKASREELGVEFFKRGIELQLAACYETIPAELSMNSQAVLAGAEVIFIGAPSAWAVARSFVRKECLVVTSGATTGAIVRETHDYTIDGWGEESKNLLAEMAKSNN